MLARSPLFPSDRHALEVLFAAAEEADGRAALSEHKAIRAMTDGDDAVAAVTEIDGRIIGYAMAAFHPPSGRTRSHWGIEAVIHPSLRTGDVVQAVVHSGLDLVPDGDRVAIWAWHPMQIETVEAMGFVETRVVYEMERALPVDEEGELPSTVAIRPFLTGVDDAAWIEVNNAAFLGHPENGALRRSDLTRRFALPWFDPEDFLIAWEGGAIVGFCWTKRLLPEKGEIYLIGVRPDAHGRGLGRGLLVAGMQHLWERGAERVGLYTDGDNRLAIGLYEDLGFAKVFVNRQFTPR